MKKLAENNTSVQIKISALWASLMSCFIYCDYFGLYEKGAIMKMNEGLMGPLGQVTPQVMLGVSTMMAIPSVMIGLSVILKSQISRILNIIFPICYVAIMVASSIGSAQFYMFFATIEIFILLGILYFAVKWPKQEA